MKTGIIQVYCSPRSTRTQRWRWKVIAPNGRIMADSAEGYVTRDKCARAVLKLRNAFREYQMRVKD